MAVLSSAVSDEVFIAGHGFCGFCALVSAIVSGFEAADEQPDNPWGLPSAVLGIIGGVIGGLANALVPCDPIANTAVSDISTTVTGIRVLCKIIFSGPAQKFFKGNAVLQTISSTTAAASGRSSTPSWHYRHSPALSGTSANWPENPQGATEASPLSTRPANSPPT